MRNWMILVTVFICSAAVTSAGIGENFARSGLALKGSGMIRFYEDGNYYMLDPEFEIFVQDYFSISVNPSYSYQYNYRWNETHQTLCLGGGINQYFVSVPLAARGNAHCLGFASQVTAYPGSDLPGDWLDYTYLEVLLQYTFYHFITSRIAPYLRVAYDLVAWNLLDSDRDMDSQGELALLFGIAFHFPSRDYVFPR